VDAPATATKAAAVTRALPAVFLGDLGGWLLGFVLVGYLALEGGGYDAVVRGEVGIALWWIVLLGAATGVLGLRWSKLGWTAAGLFTGYVLLTGLATTWTESSERTIAELGRASAHLAVLALGLSAVAGKSVRPVLNGLTCAIGGVGVLAALSRMQPGWFPENDQLELLADSAHRLSYPLNYWNGLGAFMAMGVPLLLSAAAGARSRLAQALAAAAIPFACLTLYFTVSRGGTLALLVAVAVYFALHGERLWMLPTLIVGAVSSAVLIAAAGQRDALGDGLITGAALAQGDELLVVAIVVAAGAGLLQVAAGLLVRHAHRPAWTQVPRRRAATITAVATVVLAALALSLGAGERVSDSWQEFKSVSGAAGSRDPGESAADVFQRLDTVSGNGRYQVWMSAVDAMETDPLKGLGPGTFEFWWARNSTIPSFLRDAHSLVFETLAELGIPGLVLLGGMLLLMLVAGAVRTVRADPDTRTRLAAATAAFAAFVVSASIDWSWELFVLPAAALLLGAVILVGSRSDWDDEERPRPAPIPLRAGVAFASLLAIVCVAIPLAGVSAVRESQARVAAGELEPALEEARKAEQTQPYAATPALQRALVLEEAGDLAGALEAGVRATREEPTNWRTWLVRSRLEVRSGDSVAAVRSIRKARALNPRSPLLR
jgi:O-antigen ligase